MKQAKLEMELARLEDIRNRVSELEQYPTPPGIAASILYRALGEGTIVEKVVADLGSGNGVFAIGAALLGANRVFAVERDVSMVKIAKENSRMMGTKVDFEVCDVSQFSTRVDTVFMNPPFGSQRRGADVPFVEKALELSKDFYIVLNYKAGDFLRKFVVGRGEISWEERMEIPLVHSFDFQRKDVKRIEVRVAKVKVW